MPEKTPRYKPGDHCLILPKEDGEPRVKHFDCAEYKDGVVTNPMTGKVIRTRKQDN